MYRRDTTHNLERCTQELSHVSPAFPIILIQRIFDGNNGVLCAQVLVHLHHLSRGQRRGVGI